MFEWDVYHIRGRQLQDLESSLNKDNYVLFIDGSYGDIYLAFSLLPAFISHHNCAVDVLVDKKYESLAVRFHSPGLTVRLLDDALLLRNLLMTYRSRFRLAKGEIFPTLPTLHAIIPDLIITNRLNFLEVFRLLLKLPVGVPIQSGNLNSSRMHLPVDLIAASGCKVGNTVLLAFVTNTNSSLSEKVQSLIYNEVLNSGKNALFNIAGKFTGSAFKPQEAPSISIPPDIPVETAESAGWIITAESGLSAILTLQPCKAKVLIVKAKQNKNSNISSTENYSLPGIKELYPDFQRGNNFYELELDNSEEYCVDRYFQESRSHILSFLSS